VYSAGQLDKSELTFKDLHELADSFQRILRGLFHHRISYPGADKPKAPKALEPKPQEGKNNAEGPGAKSGEARPPAYGGMPGETRPEDKKSSVPHAETTSLSQ
jgi:hypothetical protein